MSKDKRRRGQYRINGQEKESSERLKWKDEV